MVSTMSNQRDRAGRFPHSTMLDPFEVAIDIVYYLKAVPWLVPGFPVATHLKHLLTLQRRLEGGGSLAFVARKYLIEAHKGSPS